MIKKVFLILLMMALAGCTGGEVSVQNWEEPEVTADKILLIVGEGGPSGSMFVRAAETYKKERGGEIYEVHNGEEFVAAFNEFLVKHGEIDHLEYFGHGNNIGLYVNQAPNVNGGLYVNDPDQNRDYLAASIYEVEKDVFSEFGWIKFNGCNVAMGFPEEDNLAQRMANYFSVDVVAPMGPTEFSKKAYAVDPIENSNYLAPDFQGDVYMVSTYSDQGFVVVEAQEVGDTGFSDVRIGQDFYEAVAGLSGLREVFGEGDFLPYENVTYGEAREFCRIAFADVACEVSGYSDEDGIRNLHALKMLVDAYGAELKTTNPWSDSYIWWANQRELLTKDFVNKKWYTRGDMAILTWSFSLI